MLCPTPGHGTLVKASTDRLSTSQMRSLFSWRGFGKLTWDLLTVRGKMYTQSEEVLNGMESSVKGTFTLMTSKNEGLDLALSSGAAVE